MYRFTVCKLPVIHGIGVDRLTYEGVGVYYMDSTNPSWKQSQVAFNDTGHAVEYTLKQIYKNMSTDRIISSEISG
jgi:hypothetical protein